ncbi:hypothetical protein [Methylophilus sp. TWE2]|uniref:hypothetical protein n=1 Tax=Methylophilus sp. TWE2 TaxID=1662285 RepID=UPI0006716786|nr:hypothetical protein [Methylophilus sp. TWE2]AKR44260.1 hypothetical protein ACJ67_13215 [Methylophilus sp. TWE2]
MKKNQVSLLSPIACVLMVTGCATVTQGTQQAISFKLEPPSTLCEITRIGDGKLGRVSASSNTIYVGKDKDDIIVTCNAPGYEQSTTKVVSGATGAGVTGVLIDFGITDMITGAMYRYPEEVTISLAPVKSETAH